MDLAHGVKYHKLAVAKFDWMAWMRDVCVT